MRKYTKAILALTAGIVMVSCSAPTTTPSTTSSPSASATPAITPGASATPSLSAVTTWDSQEAKNFIDEIVKNCKTQPNTNTKYCDCIGQQIPKKYPDPNVLFKMSEADQVKVAEEAGKECAGELLQ